MIKQSPSRNRPNHVHVFSSSPGEGKAFMNDCLENKKISNNIEKLAQFFYNSSMTERKIFIVDDEKMIRDMYEEAFAKKGYKVTSAASAEEGLEILDREEFSVMFLDLSLPGMNGVDLCKRIRKKFTTAVIYAVTGYSSFYGSDECKAVGFDDFFTKPVRLDVLFKAAQDAFDSISA